MRGSRRGSFTCSGVIPGRERTVMEPSAVAESTVTFAPDGSEVIVTV
jgi:hypothetical protein